MTSSNEWQGAVILLFFLSYLRGVWKLLTFPNNAHFEEDDG